MVKLIASFRKRLQHHHKQQSFVSSATNSGPSQTSLRAHSLCGTPQSMKNRRLSKVAQEQIASSPSPGWDGSSVVLVGYRHYETEQAVEHSFTEETHSLRQEPYLSNAKTITHPDR